MKLGTNSFYATNLLQVGDYKIQMVTDLEADKPEDSRIDFWLRTERHPGGEKATELEQFAEFLGMENVIRTPEGQKAIVRYIVDALFPVENGKRVRGRQMTCEVTETHKADTLSLIDNTVVQKGMVFENHKWVATLAEI